MAKTAVCPACHGFSKTRLVPIEKGYDPKLRHWVCDYCKIGWYVMGKATDDIHIRGDLASARKAYVPPKN